VVLYGNQRYAEAAGWFATMAQGSRQRNGDSHFFTAQASGLQGAALWHSGLPGHKSKALGLLKTAVQHYMLPANADFLENTGIRKELREAVFAAYLEALATSPGEDATQAIGAADWVRAGVVQEALNDAAVRAAASTPELSTVVRQEQDAKNEVLSLRRYLSGDAGAAESPLPGIANQMRARIGVLEAERVQLQAQIKAKFPDYERLVRPTALLPQDIARLLAPQQALLLILPTQQAVYVWAVAPDKPAGFARVALPQDQIKALVQRLRLQFDFNANPSAGTKFDNQAAFTLYDQLLAPLAGVWQGKSQLIVAAAGDLSQLPFGLLQTRVHEGFGSSAPWLINEASVTQVPSLSAWIAIKSIAKSKSATEVFSGWGDPDFGGSSATAAPSGGTSSRKIALTRASSLTDLEALDSPQPPTAALKYANIPTLPDTRVELMAIANSLKADTSHDLLLGKNATRQSVLAASQSGALFKKRVLAFATHGLMAGDLPHLTQPALALAASSADVANPLEPLLTLEDVLTLKLNADWVVLSACNTAAADGKAEEALSGLARGFFYAGSRSLLVTHWAVESESARLLTTATFAHYAANPQAPKAESLRQGMLSVMRMPDYQHPAFWAPYALVGDGGR
jgi:CHAT domain-containing protein